MQPDKVLPLYLAPQGGLVPHAYRVYKHSQICRCGAIHEWSETVSKTMLRSTLGVGKYVTNGRPIHAPEDIQYNLPIELVVMEPKKVLFCHECFATASLAHLPRPPKPSSQTVIGGFSQPPKAAAPPAAKRPKATAVTIDDLLI